MVYSNHRYTLSVVELFRGILFNHNRLLILEFMEHPEPGPFWGLADRQLGHWCLLSLVTAIFRPSGIKSTTFERACEGLLRVFQCLGFALQASGKMRKNILNSCFFQ